MTGIYIQISYPREAGVADSRSRADCLQIVCDQPSQGDVAAVIRRAANKQTNKYFTSESKISAVCKNWNKEKMTENTL